MPKTPHSAAKTGLPEVDRFRSLLSDGNLLGAEAAGLRLLRSHPGNDDLHHALGHALARHGMPRSALPHLEKAADLKPENARYFVSLGRALYDVSAFASARTVLERAVELDDRGYEAHVLLARLHALTDTREQVEQCFRRAILLAPPARKSSLENQWLDMRISWGDLDQVAAEAEEAIRDGSATSHQLATYIRIRTPDTASTAHVLVNAMLATSELSAETRVELLHAKALVLEKSGQFEAAFATLSKTKAMTESQHFQVDFDAYVSRMLKVMTRGSIQALAREVGDPGFTPVFIVGVPRSGTTLTEQILSSHSRVGGAGEASSMREVLQLLAHSKVSHDASLDSTMQRIGFDRVVKLRDCIRNALNYRTGGAPIVVDKTPHHFMTIHLILVLFPNARIVHCYRDPADNFMSAFRLNMTRDHAYANSPEAYARFYKSYVRLMQHWQREFPDRIFAMRYESLVAEPEAKIRSLLGFLDLDWEAACLTPQQNAARVTTPSNIRVRRPINAASVGASRPYAAQIGDAFLPPEDFAFQI